MEAKIKEPNCNHNRVEGDEPKEPISVRDSIVSALGHDEAKAPYTTEHNEPGTVRESIVSAIEEQDSEASATLDQTKELPEWAQRIKDPEARRLILEREQQLKDTNEYTAKHKDKISAFDEMEKSWKPHLAAIQRQNITVPQVVDNMFTWFDGLAQPDMALRADTLKQLAQKFKIDLSMIDKVPNRQSAPQISDADVQQINGSIEKFSKDKAYPHFMRVKGRMAQLLGSGAIPFIDSPETIGFDFKRAYQLAVSLDSGLSGAAAVKKAKAQISTNKEKAPTNLAMRGNTVRDALKSAFAQAGK